MTTEPEQLKLFDMAHVHVYETYQGPHVKQPRIDVKDRGTEWTPEGKTSWCWPCARWVKQ